MITFRSLLLPALLLAALTFAPAASAEFEVTEFTGGVFDREGNSYSQAGGHPDTASTTFQLPVAGPNQVEESLKDVEVELPPGFLGNPTITPTRCNSELLYARDSLDHCPPGAQVGVATPYFAGFLGSTPFETVPVYVMEPAFGQPALFAFMVSAAPVYLVPEIRSDTDYGVTVRVSNIDQLLPISGSSVTLWGDPSDPSHDQDRGRSDRGYQCSGLPDPECSNPSGYPETAFITTPSNCSAGPMPTTLHVDSWPDPTDIKSASFEQDTNGTPTAVGGCDQVPFTPDTGFSATTDQAETATGLDATISFENAGLENPDGLAESPVKKTVVTLPKGVTLNPSAGEGLTGCTRADLARETADSVPGSGCPNQSRLGSVDIKSPLLDEHLEGSLYQALPDDPSTPQPDAENPFDSLLALYVVVRSPERGVVVKVPGKVDLDPASGQLVTTFDDLPQLPFSKFKLHFREGARAPLVTPQACGTYTTHADFVPWSAEDPDHPNPSEIRHTTSQFQITRGVGGGPCPSGGVPSLAPHLIAGTRNNNAGSYSPFDLRLFRQDGEQEFTHFSIKLPPGVTGKLAGTSYCPESSIQVSKAKTGAEELATPSCPQSSEVGSTLVGAGVGSLQTYVPGKVYLAGPYNGSNLSIVAITAAKVGPFDLGTVVVREALRIDRRTAEVFIDSTGSDPLPHIIDGVTTHLRDIRVYVDRPDFVLNPTNCDPTSVASTVLGSGLDFASPADDLPVTATTPFQAANCASLPFKPELKLSVSGSTKRAGNPAFKAVLNMKPGEANIAKAQVTLPGSEFLDNSHIRTVCTRVQYAAEQCPAGSVYGRARAFTPILDQPLEGPVYLRSNPEHELPDLVAKLQNGQIAIDLVGRVDSFGKGQIRNTFEAVPDAPVSKFVLELAGGKKGLLENSRDLCAHKYRALANFDGQNGKIRDFTPRVKPESCGHKKKRKR